MKVKFDAEVRDHLDGYTTESGKIGKIVHYYENDTCLVFCENDNMLYRVKLIKIQVLEKKGILG